MVTYLNGLHIRGHHHLIEPSGSAYIHPYDNFLEMCSGTYQGIDAYIHTGEEKNEIVLWKCQACGKVYRLEDTLECKGCGQPITEKSRFVLK